MANKRSTELLAGNLVEKTLALDSISLFPLIFNCSAVPPQLHKRVR